MQQHIEGPKHFTFVDLKNTNAVFLMVL